MPPGQAEKKTAWDVMAAEATQRKRKFQMEVPELTLEPVTFSENDAPIRRTNEAIAMADVALAEAAKQKEREELADSLSQTVGRAKTLALPPKHIRKYGLADPQYAAMLQERDRAAERAAAEEQARNDEIANGVKSERMRLGEKMDKLTSQGRPVDEVASGMSPDEIEKNIEFLLERGVGTDTIVHGLCGAFGGGRYARRLIMNIPILARYGAILKVQRKDRANRIPYASEYDEKFFPSHGVFVTPEGLKIDVGLAASRLQYGDFDEGIEEMLDKLGFSSHDIRNLRRRALKKSFRFPVRGFGEDYYEYRRKYDAVLREYKRALALDKERNK